MSNLDKLSDIKKANALLTSTKKILDDMKIPYVITITDEQNITVNKRE